MRKKLLELLTENCDPRQVKARNWERSQAEPFNLIGTLLQNIKIVQQRKKTETETGSRDYMPQQNLQTKHQETILNTVMRSPG